MTKQMRPLNEDPLPSASMELKHPIQTPVAERRRKLFVALLCWCYLLVLLALIAVIRTYGDRNWQGTLLLFSPRWVMLLPLVLLVPLAIWINRRMLMVLGVAIIIAVFPLMGFCIGWQRFARNPAGMTISVMAFNVHHSNLRSPGTAKFFADTHPDVVAMEEMPPLFNRDLFPPEIWHISQHDELFIASQYPIVIEDDVMDGAATRFGLQTPSGLIDFIVVHLSSPHYALKDAAMGADQGDRELTRNIRYRTDEARLLSQLSAEDPRPLIIAGDWNLVPDSPLFAGKFPGMADAFESTGFGFGWTYSNKWTTVRIDHVLSNRFFEPTGFIRGPFLGSPHFPIVADLVLKAQ